MTPDERTLLSDFLRDLGQARGGYRDPEAERMIIDALRADPGAPYVLVQHAILADQALHAAQARIADLERQVSGGGGFLGNRQAPPQTAVPPSGGYGQPQGYGAAPAYAPAAPPPPGGLFSAGGGLGSFLRSAGTTAAGVAGGEMLFSGLSGLFGGHRGGGFWGGGGYGGGYGGGPGVENVTINEYGDDGGSYADDDNAWDGDESDGN
jgi:hypothetical protein